MPDIKYDDIVAKSSEIIKYAIKTSDTFALISNQVKPYLSVPPKCEFDDTISQLTPYIIKQIVGIKEWPGTRTWNNHKVMTIYKSCNQAGKALALLPNIFLPLENKLPEDICFCRKDDYWLITVSHEKLAFCGNLTKEDYKFFSQQQIKLL